MNPTNKKPHPPEFKPVAPPVYRPQTVPKVLQAKSSSVRGPQARSDSRVVQPYLIPLAVGAAAVAAGLYYYYRGGRGNNNVNNHNVNNNVSSSSTTTTTTTSTATSPTTTATTTTTTASNSSNNQSSGPPVVDKRAAFFSELSQRPQRAQETPVATVGKYKLYYHQHRNENGYHIKIDGGTNYVGINVNPNGTPMGNQSKRVASIEKNLGVDTQTATALDQEVQKLMKPMNTINVTFVR